MKDGARNLAQVETVNFNDGMQAGKILIIEAINSYCPVKVYPHPASSGFPFTDLANVGD